MRTHVCPSVSVAALLLTACGGAHSDPESPSDTSAGDSGTATKTADATSDESGTEDGDEVDGGMDDADTQFDVAAADDSAGDPPPANCVVRECVDTSASAVVSLVPCHDWQATFFPPYDEHYECWTAKPDGHFIGDSDAAFTAEDPDVLIVGRWDGGIAQLRVTRDAACNITGFAQAGWEDYPGFEPPEEDEDHGGLTVKGMTYLADGTMFLMQAPHDLGQRSPGAAMTSDVVDLMSILPVWPDGIYGHNPAVGIAVVPAGFPGAGSLKLIAEQPDTSHWFTVPLAANEAGTYDVAPAIEETQIYPPEDDWGGYYARGIAYAGVDNPEVLVPSVLIPEAWQYIVSIYELDADGNPVADTRTPFVEGLGMPSGAETDAVSSNNFVFTGRRSQDVYVIRGCQGDPSGDPPG